MTPTSALQILSLHDALPICRWWVLGDRMQAASGAGFALENRVATTRALSDIYGEMHVHRLAGFFRRFRRSEEHTSELQSRLHLVCRLLLEKKKERRWSG